MTKTGAVLQFFCVRYRKKAFWEIIQDALPIKKKLVTIPELQYDYLLELDDALDGL